MNHASEEPHGSSTFPREMRLLAFSLPDQKVQNLYLNFLLCAFPVLFFYFFSPVYTSYRNFHSQLNCKAKNIFKETILCKAQEKGYTENEKLLPEEHEEDLSFHSSCMVCILTFKNKVLSAWIVHLGHSHKASWQKQHSLSRLLLQEHPSILQQPPQDTAGWVPSVSRYWDL